MKTVWWTVVFSMISSAEVNGVINPIASESEMTVRWELVSFWWGTAECLCEAPCCVSGLRLDWTQHFSGRSPERPHGGALPPEQTGAQPAMPSGPCSPAADWKRGTQRAQSTLETVSVLDKWKTMQRLSWSHLSTSCWSSFFCSLLLLIGWTGLLPGGLSSLFRRTGTRSGWGALSGFWELPVKQPVLSLPLRDVNLSSPSFLLVGDPPKNEPALRRSNILKMSSEKVPLFSSLSWMRLQRLRTSAFAAIPVRGQLKTGRVWVRLRGLPSQSSVDDERGSERRFGGQQFPLSGAGLSMSSSSSGDSDRDASPIWDQHMRKITQAYRTNYTESFMYEGESEQITRKKSSKYTGHFKSIVFLQDEAALISFDAALCNLCHFILRA